MTRNEAAAATSVTARHTETEKKILMPVKDEDYSSFVMQKWACHTFAHANGIVGAGKSDSGGDREKKKMRLISIIYVYFK